MNNDDINVREYLRNLNEEQKINILVGYTRDDVVEAFKGIERARRRFYQAYGDTGFMPIG